MRSLNYEVRLTNVESRNYVLFYIVKVRREAYASESDIYRSSLAYIIRDSMKFHINAIKKFTPSLLFFLFLAFLMAGCNQEPAPPSEQKAPDHKGTIVAVGDSLTEGLGVTEELAYPAVLENKLQSKGYHYRVVNAGVSGETSSGTLARIKWVLKLKPDIVILVIGANDGFRGIDPELIKSNILSIVRELKHHEVTVLLGGMQMGRNLGEEYISAFEAIYPEVAKEENIGLIPFFLTGVAAKPNLNQTDGIHPTAEGYQVVVEHIFPFVIKAIQDHSAN
jgi:acyl-CoA thioesterase-1